MTPCDRDEVSAAVSDERLAEFTPTVSEQPLLTRRAPRRWRTIADALEAQVFGAGSAATQEADMTPCDDDEVSDERLAEFTRIISERPPPIGRARQRRRTIEDAAALQVPADSAAVIEDSPGSQGPGEGATVAQESDIGPCAGDAVTDDRMAEVTRIISEPPEPIRRAGAAAGHRRARRFPDGLSG